MFLRLLVALALSGLVLAAVAQTPTPTPTPLLDTDGDGCADDKEIVEWFNPWEYWDFYDVPVPAQPDPFRNGVKDQAITLFDLLATLFWVGTYEGDADDPNPNGVTYDSDWDFDGEPDGWLYDRSVSPLPNPPWDAGPPDGGVNIQDVLLNLAQVGFDCRGPVATPTAVPPGNTIEIDADIYQGGIQTSRIWGVGFMLTVGITFTAADIPYQGYQAKVLYDDAILSFNPTADLNGDTVPESWTYTHLGGMVLDGTNTQEDSDGDTLDDAIYGMSARISGTSQALGVVAHPMFKCETAGVGALHLVTLDESSVFGTTMSGEAGAFLNTVLANAAIECVG